jgi:hypothetical protein
MSNYPQIRNGRHDERADAPTVRVTYGPSDVEGFASEDTWNADGYCTRSRLVPIADVPVPTASDVLGAWGA